MVASFALGLTAKPMLVSLPLVLLLLDYWPLGRFAKDEGETRNVKICPMGPIGLMGPISEGGRRKAAGGTWKKCLLEKIPLFLLAAASCAITLVAQHDALKSLEHLSLGQRAANAAVAYVAYIGKMLYPAGLAVLYPLPKHPPPAWEVAAAVAVLAAISAAAVLARRKCPYLLCGWLWYLGSLLPVIGLVQVGSQSMADRYTYLTQIGLVLAIAWGAAQAAGILRMPSAEAEEGMADGVVADLRPSHDPVVAGLGPSHAADRRSPEPRRPSVESRRGRETRAERRWALAVLAALVLEGLMVCAWRQTRYWRNSETLWTHTLACTSANPIAENNLGKALAERGELVEAMDHYRRALAFKPDYAEAEYNLGWALADGGQFDAAIEHYERALKIKSDFVDAHNNLGNALAGRGQAEAAMAEYHRALALAPGYAKPHNNLANALARRGQIDEAIAEYHEALKLKPDYANAHYNLGNALAGRGQFAEAIEQYRRAVASRPGYVAAHNNLGLALARRGKADEAIAEFRQVLAIDAGFAKAHYNIGNVLAGRGQLDEAIAEYRQDLALRPAMRRRTIISALRWPAGARSTRPSPSTGRPWQSGPTLPMPATTWTWPWPAGPGRTRPSPAGARRWSGSPTA